MIGSFYGAVTTGMHMTRYPHQQPTSAPMWMGAAIMYWGFAGLITTNPLIGLPIGVDGEGRLRYRSFSSA